jgi:hypothetical protein
MPTRGEFADGVVTRWDYVKYVVGKQRRVHTLLLLAVLLAFGSKLFSFAAAASFWGMVGAALLLVVATYELYEELTSYAAAGRKKSRRLTSVEVGSAVTVPLERIRPGRLQSLRGFRVAYSGADSIMVSDTVDAMLRSRDWALVADADKPRRVSKLIAQHRGHALGCLAHFAHDALRSRKMFENERKLCLADELSAERNELRVCDGGYFDSVCTNEASTLVLQDESFRSHPFHGGPLFPARLFEGGHELDDLHDSNLNNHVGVTTLGITSDCCFVIWQQGNRVVEGPGKVIATASGSVDFADWDGASLKETLQRAIAREFAEETKSGGLFAGVDASTLVHRTHVIGFFRWLQRGGKPEFLAISRLQVDSASLRPDGVEVSQILVKDPAGDLMPVRGVFQASTLDELPQAIAGIRRFQEGCADFGPLPFHVGLRRILDVMEGMLAREPAALRRILYGDD